MISAVDLLEIMVNKLLKDKKQRPAIRVEEGPNVYFRCTYCDGNIASVEKSFDSDTEITMCGFTGSIKDPKFYAKMQERLLELWKEHGC